MHVSSVCLIVRSIRERYVKYTRRVRLFMKEMSHVHICILYMCWGRGITHLPPLFKIFLSNFL